MSEKPRIRYRVAGQRISHAEGMALIRQREVQLAAETPIRVDERSRPLSSAGYLAARQGRRLGGWNPTKAAINAIMQLDGDNLVARARDLVRNDAYMAGGSDTFASYAVGAGITMSSQHPNRTTRQAINQLWQDWTAEADADGITNLNGLMQLASRAMWDAGEMFLRDRPRRIEDGLTVPYQLQAIEAEQLPRRAMVEHERGGRDIRQGIEFDGIARRRGYHFFKRHPGERGLDGTAATAGDLIGLDQTSFVPADMVHHVYRPLRPGQIRGVPWIAPIMVRAFLLDSYDDAESERKRTAALIAGFIESAGDAVIDEELDPLGRGYETDWEPGTLQRLAPGEKITFSTPADVGPGYDAFQIRQLLAMAAGSGTPYASLSGDPRGASYASQRVNILDFRRKVEQFQELTLIFQFLRPVFYKWLDYAALAGVIDLGDYLENLRDYRRHEAIMPAWPWVDPEKDMKGEVLAVQHGFKDRSDVVQANGYLPEEMDEKIAETKKREKRLGLKFGVQPSAPAAAPPAGDPDEDEDPADEDEDEDEDAVPGETEEVA